MLISLTLAACASAGGPGASASGSNSDPHQTPSAHASASTDRPAWEGIVAAPVTPSTYRETLMLASDGGTTLDLEGILVEYTRAAATFPFSLPDGWTFPVDPGYKDDPDVGPNWSRALNLQRVWNFWEYANAVESEAAFRRGDTDAAARYLDVIQSGYESVVYPLNYADPPEVYIDGVLSPARSGDYSHIHTLMTNPFDH